MAIKPDTQYACICSGQDLIHWGINAGKAQIKLGSGPKPKPNHNPILNTSTNTNISWTYM